MEQEREMLCVGGPFDGGTAIFTDRGKPNVVITGVAVREWGRPGRLYRDQTPDARGWYRIELAPVHRLVYIGPV